MTPETQTCRWWPVRPDAGITKADLIPGGRATVGGCFARCAGLAERFKELTNHVRRT